MTMASTSYSAQAWNVREAFDDLASVYDTAWTHSVIGRLQRDVVWGEIDGIFRPRQRVLDLGCGVGSDAVHLARAGVRVHAIDIAPAMLRATQERVTTEGLSGAVTCELRALEDLSRLRERGPFDGALSNFGVLNCVEDLHAIACSLAELIRPGGRLVICLMGRFCLWETVWYSMQAKPTKAFRRWLGEISLKNLFSRPRGTEVGQPNKSGGVRSSVGAGPHFEVFYPTVRSVGTAFEDSFRLVSYRSVGVLIPPSYVEGLAKAVPGLCRGLALLDCVVGGWPVLRATGDHRLLIFVRT